MQRNEEEGIDNWWAEVRFSSEDGEESGPQDSIVTSGPRQTNVLIRQVRVLEDHIPKLENTVGHFHTYKT